MSVLYRLKTEIAAALTEDFLLGRSEVDVGRFREPIGELPGVDIELTKDLLAHALSQELHNTELDRWLAPRLHYVVRLPRRLAADRGFWAWIAVEVAPAIVRRRFPHILGEKVNPWRFTGPLTRNAVARLWWGAEMTRNGPDYNEVERVFARVRTAQFALELKYSWYRPAAIAFTRVAEAAQGGQPLTDAEMKALSKKINAYLSLASLESLGLDAEDEALDEAWRNGNPAPTRTNSVSDVLPRGPDDGYASTLAVEYLENWFRELGGQRTGRQQQTEHAAELVPA